MANAIKWEAAWASAGTVLDANLDSLANATRCAVETAYDNSTGLNQYGCLDITLGSITAASGGYLTIYMVNSADGTNYSEGDGTVDPGNNLIVAVIPLYAATRAIRKVTPIFPLPPGKVGFLLKNDSGVALAASGNLVVLYVSNDEVQ